MILLKASLFLLSGLCVAAMAAETPAAAELSPPVVVVPAEVHEIAPEMVERQLVDHPETVIIDVRQEEERQNRGYILNSINLDYFHGQKTLDLLAQMDKTKPCIVYCALGGRAQRIAVEMHKMGFKNILLLKGGFNAWTAAGQAVAR
ncbi:rhodanese-like domain-containing protein [Prosthecobacter vanneervenii]|uniref:Rhodanese-related sulfurtransferase n=1 Tax=Prosthecobacter vanneervenii TaxID=48466 RepID=A0A7W7Y8V2_9BACT|nr:rhodanese-like domain-containing protein [Prosthecobacter vanneervenii]MBB5031751.1 rhodanese-related sulfurtransferase [Prosthecobacter vanneervenii]